MIEVKIKNNILDDPPSHIVLSVGGNDVREILKSMHLIRQVIHKYHSNGERILNRIQNMKTKLVLMMQFMGGSGCGATCAAGTRPPWRAHAANPSQ